MLQSQNKQFAETVAAYFNTRQAGAEGQQHPAGTPSTLVDFKERQRLTYKFEGIKVLSDSTFR